MKNWGRYPSKNDKQLFRFIIVRRFFIILTGRFPPCRKPREFPSIANLKIFKGKLLFVRFRILPWSMLCFTWDILRDCFELYEIVFVIVLNYMRTILHVTCFTWDSLRDCFELYAIVFVIILNYMRTILVSWASGQGSKTSPEYMVKRYGMVSK